MQETFSDSEYIEIDLIMIPVPPGTKARPRPPDRPREVYIDDEKKPLAPETPPANLPPGKAADAD